MAGVSRGLRINERINMVRCVVDDKTFDKMLGDEVDLDVSDKKFHSTLPAYLDVMDKIDALKTYSHSRAITRDVENVEQYIRMTLHVAGVVLRDISKRNVPEVEVKHVAAG